VAEDAQLLGTATPMQASSGTGGYLSVWSSISALGALRSTDSMPLMALAYLGLVITLSTSAVLGW
jgi:hypothetical protein